MTLTYNLFWVRSVLQSVESLLPRLSTRSWASQRGWPMIWWAVMLWSTSGRCRWCTRNPKCAERTPMVSHHIQSVYQEADIRLRRTASLQYPPMMKGSTGIVIFFRFSEGSQTLNSILVSGYIRRIISCSSRLLLWLQKTFAYSTISGRKIGWRIRRSSTAKIQQFTVSTLRS